MKKIRLFFCITLLLILLCSCGKKGIEGSWNCDSIDELELTNVVIKLSKNELLLTGTSIETQTDAVIKFRISYDDEFVYLLELLKIEARGAALDSDALEEYNEMMREDEDYPAKASYNLPDENLLILTDNEDGLFSDMFSAKLTLTRK